VSYSLLILFILCWPEVAGAAPDNRNCAGSGFVAARAGFDFTADLDRWGTRDPVRLKADQEKTIGDITINRLPIFDLSDPRENNALYRWGNRVHFDTRLKVIEDLLLFEAGDSVDAGVLAETERILRGQNYIADAKIRTVSDCGDTIDLEVVTKKVWTMLPELSLKSSGGHSSSRIGMRDANFLGTGKQFSLVSKRDIDRNSVELHYKDKNIAGSRVRLRSHLVESSDGHRRLLQLDLPFYSLDSRRSWRIAMEQEDRDDNQYRFGKKDSIVSAQARTFETSVGFSKGLQKARARRYLVGFGWEETVFGAIPNEPVPATFPNDIHLAYPFLEYQSIEDNYVVAFNIDQMHRAEDLHIGNWFRNRISYSTWKTDQFVFEGTFANTLISKNKQLLQSQLEWQGRWNDDLHQLQDTRLDLSVRYHRGQTDKRSLYVGFRTSVAENLNSNQQLVLGGETGLRGFPTRYQSGDYSINFTLEERFFTDHHPYNLVNVGYAVFVDSGQAGFRNGPGSSHWLTNVGFGLRLAPSKADKGKVIHLDIAFPLNRNLDHADAYQISAQMKKSL